MNNSGLEQPRFLIVSPEGAVLSASENLYEGADPDAALIATIHQVEDQSVGNLWRRYMGETQRLQPERAMTRPPSLEQLMGEVVRFGTRKPSSVIIDAHMSLAIRGLNANIAYMMEERDV